MSAHAAMVLPLLVCLLLAATARRLGCVLPPARAVPLLCAASVMTALATGFSLSVVAFTFLAQGRPLAAAGHWSVHVLQAIDPMPPALGIPAACVVTCLVAAAVSCLIRHLRQLLSIQRACRYLGPDAHGLVVLDDERADAFALPGVTGRIVVSTAMLHALRPLERRAMLAHETSHLRRRHYLYLLMADLSAAANPLLRPVAAAIRVGIERWADEDAATELGDRRLVAQALARAAQASGRMPSTAPCVAGGPVLRMTGSSLMLRTRALLAPPPQPRRVLAAALAAVCLLTAASTLLVARDTNASFERAQAVSSLVRR